jgi:hypothetical protein
MNRLEHGVRQARIAALRMDASESVQELMASFAQDLLKEGVKVAGVTQGREQHPITGRRRVVLRDLRSGAHYPISQDLGPGSVACNLDTSELATACAAIEHAAQGGAELIIISKFSKQEAERGGLSDAFRAAITAKSAIVTAVSPHFLDEWSVFAGPLARFVEPDLDALHKWFQSL